MTQRIPDTFSMLDWSRALIMGNIPPPRDPNDNDGDEDEERDTEDEREPAVIREPDEED